MRILYLHQHFCTPKGHGGPRSYEFARRWVKSGHEVTVVTGVGYDPSLEPESKTTIDGISVHAIGSRYSANFSFARRLFSFLSFSFRSLSYAFKMRDYDVILATSTPLFIAIPALCAKWISRKPMFFEVRDVWPDAAIDAGQLSNPILIYAAKCLEKLAYNNAENVVALSTGMESRIIDKGISEDKLSMIPNCSDIDKSKASERIQIREKLNPDNKFIILYSGSINLANNMELLADVIDKLQNESQWEWWFVGEGNRYEWIQTEAETRNWKNVRFFGYKPKEEIPEYIAAADAGIISFITPPVFYENSPNKFFDYIAGSLPIIFTRSTWLEPYIDKYQCGLIDKESSAENIFQHIIALKNDSDLRDRMGIQSRKLAEEEFSRDMMAEKYLELMSSALKE